jgi:hypothetical protein
MLTKSYLLTKLKYIPKPVISFGLREKNDFEGGSHFGKRRGALNTPKNRATNLL